jgi:membrane protein implicated in regulation of membrane protease activity
VPTLALVPVPVQVPALVLALAPKLWRALVLVRVLVLVLAVAARRASHRQNLPSRVRGSGAAARRKSAPTGGS